MWHNIHQDQNRPGEIGLVVLLIFPAAMICIGLATGQPWRWGIRPSGDISAKLLIAALAISPLRVLFPHQPLLHWLERQRRKIGLAAFLYALLHAVIFAASIGRFDWILQGMAFASMWTGWISFMLLAGVAAISNDGSRVWLGVWWKRLQRLTVIAAALALAHWLLLTRSPAEALLYFVPLFALRTIMWLPHR